MNNNNNRGSEIRNKIASKAASSIGGPLAGKAVEKLGKKNGNSDLISRNALPSEQNKQVPSDNNTSIDNDASIDNTSSIDNGLEESNSSKSPLNSLKNRLLGNQNNDQSGNASIGASVINSFIKKHWKKIIPALGGFFLILFLMILIPLGVASIGGTVIEFFTGIGDAIVGFFHVDEEERIFQYYEKLEKVQARAYARKGVCIDPNLITATLTVDLDAAGYVKQSHENTRELEESDEDSFPITESTGADGYEGFQDDSNDFDYISEFEEEDVDEKYKKMTKEVELLANMQIKTIKYGHNKKLKGEGVIPIDSHGNPKFSVLYMNKCWPEDSEYEDEPVSEETLEDYDLPGFDAWTNWNINGTFVSDSVNEVAKHDKKAFYKFFAKKAKEETNYQFTVYNPKIETSCDEETGECEQVCNWKLPKNRYELSIGDLNTMEQSVYYWNLVNSFIPEYYDEYLPDKGNPQRDEAIKGIAELIYLLYNDLGPGESCAKYEPQEVLCDTDEGSSYYNSYTYDPSAHSTQASTQEFYDRMSQYAIAAMSETGINASVIMAVADFESGAGSNTLANEARNYFSIKANSDSITVSAIDYRGRQLLATAEENHSTGNGIWSGAAYAMPNADGAVWWRAYGSMEESTMDFAYMVSGMKSRIYNCNTNSSPEDQIRCIVYSGYCCAADDIPCKENYIRQVLDKINTYDLTQFDIGEWDGEYHEIDQSRYLDNLSICIETKYGSGGIPGDWENWKQYDPRWKDIKISSKTIGEVGCLVTSIAIQVARSGADVSRVSPFDPGTFVEALKAHGQFNGNALASRDVSWLVPNFHQLGGHHSYNLEEMKRYLSEGKYIVLDLCHSPGGNASLPVDNRCLTEGGHGEHHVAVNYVEGDKIYMYDPGGWGSEVSTASWGQYILTGFTVHYVD